MSLRATVLFLVSACLAAAQQKKPSPTPAAPTQASPDTQVGGYKGTVVSTAGAPVSDARIILRGASQGTMSTFQNTVSGLDGKFEFSQLDAGRYVAQVQRPGFIMASQKNAMQTLIDVKAGSDTTGTITLAPESVITGRVVDASGQPVEFANVQVMKLSGLRNGRTTNERGEFRLYGLQPGRYLVLATPALSELPAEIRADGSREEENLPTFFPNSTTVDGGTRVELAEGASVSDIEIRLARGPIAHLNGTIRGADAKEYPNFYLQAVGRAFDGMMLRQPHVEKGNFTFPRIAPGSYKLFAVVYGDAGIKSSTEELEITVSDKDIDEVVLDLVPPIDLEGRIKWTDEEKGKQQNLFQVDLTSNTRMQINGVTFAQIGENNTFQFKGLLRALYPIAVIGRQGGPAVQSIEVGGVEMPDKMLDLRHGASGPITITVSPETGDIAGKLENARPASTIVLLAEHNPARSSTRRTTVDANGQYQFKSIPIGTYKIAVVEDADVNEILASGVLGYYEPDAKTVKVAAQDSLTVDLKQP